MLGYTDFDCRIRTGVTYVADAEVDIAKWDEWWLRETYEHYRPIPIMKMEQFCSVLQRLHLRGQLEGYDFLFAMPESDREDWIDKAHRDCHKAWRENPESFPSAGIKESFDRIRRVRKAKSKSKKLDSEMRKAGLSVDIRKLPEAASE